MAIDTTKKVTGISYNGTTLQLASTKDYGGKISVPTPEGASGIFAYEIYDGGVVILYNGSKDLYVYDYATETNTRIAQNISITTNPIIEIIDNKRCFVYSSDSSAFDNYLIDLETKTGQKICYGYNTGLINWVDNVYTFNASSVSDSSLPISSAGVYRYNMTNNTFVRECDVLGSGDLFNINTRYITGFMYYDSSNDTFGNIDITAGHGAANNAYARLVRSIGTDIAIIWDTNSNGACGYYVYSENKTYPFTINNTAIKGFTKLAEFSNHNFIMPSTTTAGLYFFNYSTKTLTAITSTGFFSGGYQTVATQWCYFQNDVFISANSTGELVEVDNTGTSHSSTVTTNAGAGTSGFNYVLLNNKLYFTRALANFGIWEYDFTTHTATQVYASNTNLTIMFVMENDIYLSSTSSSPAGLYKLDITNQTATQVFAQSYGYTGCAKVETDYYVIGGSGYKLRYQISTGTFNWLSTKTNVLYTTDTIDLGDGVVLYQKEVKQYQPIYDNQNPQFSSHPASNVWIYNKNNHNFMNIQSSSNPMISGSYVVKYKTNKLLVIGGTSYFTYIISGSTGTLHTYYGYEFLGYGGGTAYITLLGQTEDYATLLFFRSQNVSAMLSINPNNDKAIAKFDFDTETMQLEEYDIQFLGI